MVRACFPTPVAFGRRGFFVGIGIGLGGSCGTGLSGSRRPGPPAGPRIRYPVGAVVLAFALRVEREWPCRWPAGHQGLSGLVSWPDQAVRGWVG